MTYEPYEPGGHAGDSADSSQPSFDIYDPAAAQDYSSGSSLRSPVGSRPTRFSSSRSSSGSGGVVGRIIGAGAGIGLVAVIVGIAQSNSNDPVDPIGRDRQDYSACSAAHDETYSTFSDGEWCDLELNGGDGDGRYDEDPFDLRDRDPSSFDDYPYGYSDGSGLP